MDMPAVSTRLSHAYCRDCDVIFNASLVCPRCGGIHVTGPPAGVPRVTALQVKRRGRKWVGHDTGRAKP